MSLAAYQRAETVAEAERALDALPDLPEVGDLYDDLAVAAVEADRDYCAAARLQRKALEHGCTHATLGRQMLGWYLLRDGQHAAGEAEFAALLADLGEDPQTLYTLASARFDTGQWDEALVTFDRALAAARARGDAVLVEEVLAERRYCRAELGLPPDEDDAMTPDPSPHPEEIAVALAWFPRDEHAEALRRWPELGEDLADPDAYCAAMEARLREISAATARNPAVAPLRVAALAEFADERGLDPDSGEARSQWAAELQRRGEAIAWPPGRNEPCWCGSERKYKRCCGGRGR